VLVAAGCWYLAVQLLIEGQFCPYCCAMHVCGLLAFAYVAPLTLFGRPPEESLGAMRVAVPTAALATVLLIAGQLWGPQPATHQITQEDDAFIGDADAVAASSQAIEPPAESRTNVEVPDQAEGVPVADADADAASSVGPPSDASRANDGSLGNVNRATNGGPATIDTPNPPASDGDAIATSEQVPVRADRASDVASSDPAASADPPSADPSPGTRALNKPIVPRVPPTDPAAASAIPVTEPSTVATPATETGHVVSYFGGAIKYTVEEVPLLGKPDAAHILVKYFDYTCPACKRMHHDLDAAMRAYPDELAVIVMPCPLERHCNPHSPTLRPGQRDPHAEACGLSTLALSVWRADRSKFRRFHDELFDRQGNITLKAAQIMASGLVGEEAVGHAGDNRWAAELIQHSVSIYGRLKSRNPRMPKLLLGDRKVMHGIVSDSVGFQRVLQDQFQLGR
jgi:protein-disulfide isomerase